MNKKGFFLDNAEAPYKLNFKSKSEMVYNKLKEAILTGSYKPGEELTESGIAERLGTSKTPVRDALIQLKLEGFIKLKPYQKGVQVIEIQQKSIENILELRYLLEPYAARVAASKFGDKDIKVMKTILDEMRKYSEVENDIIKSLQKHHMFHSMIYYTVDNQQYQIILDNLHEHLERFVILGLSDPEKLKFSLEEYQLIINALENKDPDSAEAALKNHIKNVSLRKEMKPG